jgi:2-polyprenyl-3-methyl-5-hydroxy-6-metoxy-1,4-benzoquinol methylase
VQDQEAIAVGYWRQLQQLAADRGLTPLKSVLDVGCGSGQFLLQARSGGAVVAGLELDPAQVAACRERGIPVHSGSLFDLGAPPGPWQAITLWDVLDHLDEPVEALRILIRELEPGGIVVARGRNGAVHVPLKVARVACPSVFGRLPDLSVVHRWALSPTAWAGLFERAGLENVRLLAGVPTVGDRYRMMGAAPVGAFMKRALRDASVMLSRCTNGKCYVFPSVLLVGRKPL